MRRKEVKYKGFNYCLPGQHLVGDREIIWHVSVVPLVGGRDMASSIDPLYLQVCNFHVNQAYGFIRSFYDQAKAVFPKDITSLY